MICISTKVREGICGDCTLVCHVSICEVSGDSQPS